MRISNFQSFGPKAVEFDFDDITYLIGPNGSGKTAALQALCRLFAFDPAMRRVRRSDFHVAHDEAEVPDQRTLWIEADFHFPELEEESEHATIPPNFGHMRLDDPEGVPRVRFRLDAALDVDGNVDETFVYVLDLKPDGSPLNSAQVPKAERNHIHIHYLPARRDPAEHITYGANALLGRLLRAVNWENEREAIKELTDKISDSLATNPSIKALSRSLKKAWSHLHKGNYFADPAITFVTAEIDALLRHLSVSFSPGHEDSLVDFSRLSDGQKSMLYLSLVLSSQAVGRAVLTGKNTSFDPERLRPPIFTLIAIEEPENSLSPHYLGRIVSTLAAITRKPDAQAVIATHAPSILRRVDPKQIRYLRLTKARTTGVKRIPLPDEDDAAHKFVREGVQAFPEIYFSRLVILGEGDSEEIVLPRILRAKKIHVDGAAVTVAPLGGRHVNHFWRLLAGLDIPHITLLDLDVGRYQGGWGRFKYANDELLKYRPDKVLPKGYVIPAWNDKEYKVRDYLNYLEQFAKRDVFFSSPLDLDFAMLSAFPKQYGAKQAAPGPVRIKAVLGKKSAGDASQYKPEEAGHFGSYHRKFKLSSKPTTHLVALSRLSDMKIRVSMPPELARLAAAVEAKLKEAPE